MYDYIPAELKLLSNWVCWAAIPDEERGKSRKIPVNPHTLQPAKSNDPTTWSDFDTAVRQSDGLAGIGFMFSNSPYFGVDIDNISGEIEKYKSGEPCIITEFVDTLQSYCELSTSGTGIHIICRGKLPENGRRKGNVEMYDNGRFFVMTGNNFSEYADITDCTEIIKPLHEKYIGGGSTPAKTPISIAPVPETMNDIITLAKSAKNGAAFSRLYSGDCSGYTSQSEADLAFCNMLAFWCRCDAGKMDSIYRSSGLMRDKWDRQQSGSTYGIITLQKAITDCTHVYEPKPQHNIAVGNSDETEATPRMYSFDDMGNAQRIYDAYGGYLRYSYTDKRWMFYDTRKWCVDYSGEVERAAEQSIKSMDAEGKLYDPESDEGKSFMKHRKASRSNKAQKAMLDELKHKVAILPSQTDKDKLLINTLNGVLNLSDGTTAPHNAEQYMTKIVPVEYDASAECPIWLKFLDDIFAGDTDLIRYVQKAAGYSLSGSTAEQCVFFLYGSGSNGKSTFLSVLREIAGDYAANIQPQTIMVKPNSGTGANSDIARLKSARFVTSVEPNEGMRLDEGLIKQLSGDDPVTARKLYGDEFEFKPEFKLWMATNHKPIIRGTDTGIWRRVHMIPFEVQIPDEKKDKHLSGKLSRELPGVFRWAVEGFRLYQSEGLKMPAAVLNAVAEYRHEMDVISLFIEDCCTDGGEIQAQVLYEAYKNWAKTNEQYIHTSTKFGIEMAKKYQKTKRRALAYYIGLHLSN